MGNTQPVELSDRTLPLWCRLILAGTAISQIFFGLTLLFNPAAVASLWPWTLSSIAARLLGASTLVAIPLSLGSAVINRWSAARIPTVMNLTYRVLQIGIGLTALNRFDFSRPVTWNYFGGGSLMLLFFALLLWRGPSMGKAVVHDPHALRESARLRLGPWGRRVLVAGAVVYFVFGLTLLALGNQAAQFWFEAPGQLTPLTARLFASPITGLALGLWLTTRARYWREVGIPGAGMLTIGVAGSLALLVERASIQPPSPVGYAIAATPILLLLAGLYLFAPKPAEP